jgi:hypothetical protein
MTTLSQFAHKSPELSDPHQTEPVPGNNKRLEKQLCHERELRKKEREMSLRKDIYLAAAEAISIGITTIGQFANMEIPHEKLTGAYVEKSPSIAKVHIIAGEETVKALAALLSELDGAYLTLLAKRLPLARQKNPHSNGFSGGSPDLR